MGLLLIGYGVLNTFLYYKFTPVYRATECGDQEATLERFSPGNTIRVGLLIQVTCKNPNNYAVQIKSAKPGRVFVGKDRGVMVGQLTLLEGSTLPQNSHGKIRVLMDAELSQAASVELLPHLLSDQEIPMFMELQFNVEVNVNFGVKSFGTTAPFKKKCGMNMAGILVNTARRLGPMICRSSFDEIIGQIPHVGEATGRKMSFGAAQMDPDRVLMGERLKNVSLFGVMALTYTAGFLIVRAWLMACCRVPPPNEGEVAAIGLKTYARGGFVDYPGRQCMRGFSGNLVEPLPKADTTAMPRAMNFFLGCTPYGHTVPVVAAQARTWYQFADVGPESRRPGPIACGCSLAPMLQFLTCGAAGGRYAAPRPEASVPQPSFRQSCMRATSGNVAEMPYAAARPFCMRGMSGNVLELEHARQSTHTGGFGWGR